MYIRGVLLDTPEYYTATLYKSAVFVNFAAHSRGKDRDLG